MLSLLLSVVLYYETRGFFDVRDIVGTFGVNRPGLEFWCAPDEEWTEEISPEDFYAIADFGFDSVLLPLNQQCWFEKASYRAFVEDVVSWAEDADLTVVLDLHWLDMERELAPMPDTQSARFITSLASRFPDLPLVVYAEPHDIAATTWALGGEVDGYVSVGIPQLVQEVREAGVDNWLIVGGLDWASDYRELVDLGVVPLQDDKIIYAAHFYGDNDEQDEELEWQEKLGFLQTHYGLPIAVMEYGDISSDVPPDPSHCGGDFDRRLLTWASDRGIPAFSWAWYVGEDSEEYPWSVCGEPSVIVDYDGTPSTAGEVIQEFISYSD